MKTVSDLESSRLSSGDPDSDVNPELDDLDDEDLDDENLDDDEADDEEADAMKTL